MLYVLVFLFGLFFDSLFGRSVRVIDGDTFELPSGERVRLVGLNAPELKSKNTDEKARALTAKTILEKSLVGRWTLVRKGKDKYGRTLAEVSHSSFGPLSRHLLEHHPSLFRPYP